MALGDKGFASAQRSFRRLLFFMGSLLLLLVGADFLLRPAVETMAAHQVQVYAMRWINEAMAESLAEEGIGYSSLVTLSRGSEGNVTSIEADTITINRLKTQLTAQVIESLLQEDHQTIRIHAGTLAGSQFFTGRGPEVEIRLQPAGHVTSSVYNEFVSAGINQTLHRIVLEIGVEVDAIFPFYRVKTHTTTSYVLAETVVVGNIPEGYMQITGVDSAPIAGMLGAAASS